MFKPIKGAKVYEQVVEQIKQLIIRGDLKKGDKLPTERDLAEQLHYHIAKASKNSLILNILEVLSQLIDEFIRDSRKKIYRAQKNWEALNTQHERIFNAIELRDSKGAYDAMLGHSQLIRKSNITKG